MESRVVAKVVRRGKLVRSGVAVAAAVACALAATVPALASAGSTGGPARHGDRAPGYLEADSISLGALPLSVAVDPLTDTIYAGEESKSSVSTAVINGRTDKVVARLPVFGYHFAFDSRTDVFYLPTRGGVAVIAGRTHRVVRKLPVAGSDTASDAVADPRTGHVFVAVHTGTSSSIVVLSERTNKIIDRISVPGDSSDIDPMAASPAAGVIYAGIGPSSVWVIGTRRARVLARIRLGDGAGDLAVDDQHNLVGATVDDTLTVIDGRTHQARTPVDVSGGMPDAGVQAEAEAVTPQTRTFYVGVECDPESWVTAVSEQTGKVVATIDAGGRNAAFRSMAADPRRNVVFAVDYGGGEVTIINARTNTLISVQPVGGHPGAVTVNPVTGRAYVANSDRTVSVLAPSGVSARQAGGPAAATGPATGGQAAGQRRGTCG